MYIRQNPEKVFIALRMISQTVKRSYLRYLEHTLIELLDFAESSPETIEWDEADSLLSSPLAHYLTFYAIENGIGGKLITVACRVVFTLSHYPNIS